MVPKDLFQHGSVEREFEFVLLSSTVAFMKMVDNFPSEMTSPFVTELSHESLSGVSSIGSMFVVHPIGTHNFNSSKTVETTPGLHPFSVINCQINSRSCSTDIVFRYQYHNCIKEH